VQVTFSDGYHAQVRLAELGWDVTQVLRIGETIAPVPEPALEMMLAAGLGVVLFGRRKAGRRA
jgi:hypothetical protein